MAEKADYEFTSVKNAAVTHPQTENRGAKYAVTLKDWYLVARSTAPRPSPGCVGRILIDITASRDTFPADVEARRNDNPKPRLHGLRLHAPNESLVADR